jgi:glycosyltransferase involved in cell wall biosynthesis
LVTIRHGLEGVVVPSKLYPILAAGRPVLALAPEESDAVRVIRRSGCGVVADPDDPASVATVVQELARDPERVARMSRCAAAIALQFSLQREMQRFVETMEAAV